jgi:O-acetyl-ADP-ribose deacetylase (regulator of RNase III)
VTLRVRIGELGESDADAVVRPIGSDGEAITAVGRRLEMRAGPRVAERLRGLGDLPIGGAVITPADALPAQFIIHAVLQSSEEPVSAVSVRRALVNALRRARDLGLGSLALPPMGTGAGNLQAEDAAHLMVDVLQGHLRDGEAPGRLEILVESTYEEELFTRELAARNPAGDAI